jgi:hypothetical protein
VTYVYVSEQIADNFLAMCAGKLDGFAEIVRIIQRSGGCLGNGYKT